MAKEVKSVRLSSDWEQYAKRNNLTLTELIEVALTRYKELSEPFIHNHMEIYKAVLTGIEQLEIKRDYGPDGFQGGEGIEPPPLSTDETSAHELYNKIWDDLRAHPFFIEPDIELPE